MKVPRVLVSCAVLLLFAVGAVSQTGSPSQTTAAKNHSNRDEAQIRDLYDRWAKAFRAHDVDGIMAVYAPGDAVVAYDIVPPLQYVGNDAYRKDYQGFFALYNGPLDVEFRDLRIVAGNNVAFINALERISGTLKSGQKSDIWLRATSGLRKMNGKWLIVHDHISVPTDFNTGKALLDLKP
jgi:uncharacterized protein (TIGR02246 family)